MQWLAREWREPVSELAESLAPQARDRLIGDLTDWPGPAELGRRCGAHGDQLREPRPRCWDRGEQGVGEGERLAWAIRAEQPACAERLTRLTAHALKVALHRREAAKAEQRASAQPQRVLTRECVVAELRSRGDR